MKSNIKKILILLLLGVNFVFMINSTFHFNDNQKTSLNNPVKSDGYSVSFIHIDGNWTATVSTYDWCYGNGSWGNPYVIENVSIDAGSSPTGSGIFINNSKTDYFAIRNCTVYNAGSILYDGGIRLEDTNNGTIINNNCSNNGRDGIGLKYSNNNTISENIVIDNSRGGIPVLHGSNNTISGNIVNDNGWGITILYCFYNDMSENAVDNNYYQGITISNSYYNNITRNTANNNRERGIMLKSCHYNNVTGNIAKNSQYGVWIDTTSDYNQLRENIIYNNTLGILTRWDCWNNTIYENFFLNNGNHSIDDGPDNKWNSTTIGNYWDNHTGPDMNNDGIVDMPYNISGDEGSKDYLPIAEDGVPRITINSPSEGEGFGSIAPNFSVTITEDYLDTMWYTLDGGLHNYSFTENGIINQSTWDGMADGGITLTFYTRDIPGYIGSAGVDIIKDTVDPVIIINSPAEGDRFGKNAPLFNITVIEDNIDLMWYSFDGGLKTYTITNNTIFNQSAWTALAQGDVTITFCARDIAGNEATEEVLAIKSVASGLTSGVIITIVVVSIVGGIAIAGIAYVIIKRRKAAA